MHYTERHSVTGSHFLQATSGLKNQNTTNLQLMTQFELKLIQTFRHCTEASKLTLFFCETGENQMHFNFQVPIQKTAL